MAYIKNPSEDICLPMRLSMRKAHYDKTYWYHYPHSFYSWLENFLAGSVGKPFKYIHRKVRQRCSSCITSTPLQILRDRIDFHESDRSKRYWNDYYLDSDGILRKRHWKPKKNKAITVNEYKISSGWIADTKRISETKEVRDILLQRLGPRDFECLFHPGYLGERIAYRIRNILWTTKYHSEDYVRYVDTYAQSVYERGTKSFKKFLAEQKKAQKKERREHMKRVREENEYILYAIEARRKEKDRNLNEVTRDRLGFAEDSFTGEFYHGQKRKKRKQLNTTQTT